MYVDDFPVLQFSRPYVTLLLILIESHGKSHLNPASPKKNHMKSIFPHGYSSARQDFLSELGLSEYEDDPNHQTCGFSWENHLVIGDCSITEG